MLVSLQDKIVCVTGSARRIGRTIALEFARQGAQVVIHHHASPEAAEATAETVRTIGSQALVIQANQAKPAEVSRMFSQIEAHFGGVDILVNNAANFLKGDFLEISFEEWQQAIDVNLTGPWLCSQAAARVMVAQKRKGTIINIGDNSGIHPWRQRPHHSVAKAGVVMLTKVTALALGAHGIRVNCVVPGPVLKPVEDSQESWEKLGRRLPVQRTGSPEDVARACTFLASNDFFTGAILHVDGGEYITPK